MKIDGVDPTGKGGEASKKKIEKVKGESFDSVLKSSMSEKPEKPFAVSGPAPIAQIPSMAATTSPFNARALAQVEAVLSDLELYRNTLLNNDVPLARLEPMADTLMAKKDQLVSLLPHVDDPEVRDIITRTAAMLINENSRFHGSL